MRIIHPEIYKTLIWLFQEGYLTREDFLSVAYVSMQKQANRYDDIKAAFR